ncbi:MAG: hypothetical protein ACI9HK_001155 [Pirellulaceae bacterium]|jgi:hypothetical protein
MASYCLKQMTVVMLASVTLVSYARAADADPEWTEFIAFLGVDKDNKEFQQFAKKHDLDESTKGPSGSFSSAGHSVSILYRENKFIRAMVSPRHYASGLKVYQGNLPFGLTKDSTLDDVIAIFGKPQRRQDDDYLIYRQYNLGFEFLTGKLSQITLDFPGSQR